MTNAHLLEISNKHETLFRGTGIPYIEKWISNIETVLIVGTLESHELNERMR